MKKIERIVSKLEILLDKAEPANFTIKVNPFKDARLEVIIFHKHKDLVKFLKITAPACPPYRACLSRYHDKIKLGILIFSEEYMTMEVVLHECLHASLHYFRMNHVKYGATKFNRKKEEKLCSVTEYLFSQIANKMKSKKYYSTDEAEFEYYNAEKFYKF